MDPPSRRRVAREDAGMDPGCLQGPILMPIQARISILALYGVGLRANGTTLSVNGWQAGRTDRETMDGLMVCLTAPGSQY